MTEPIIDIRRKNDQFLTKAGWLGRLAVQAGDAETARALLPKALDPKNPSAKPRQAIFEYALWHAQNEWVTALGKANFAAARQLLDEGQFWGAGSLLPNRYGFRNDAWERLESLTRKTVPWPGTLSTAISPPMLRTSSRDRKSVV